MLNLQIQFDPGPAIQAVDHIAEDIHAAWDAAVREVTLGMVTTSLRGALAAAFPSGTGRTVSQLEPKFWFNRRTGLTTASVRVRGDRRFVMHIQEFGAKTHGGRGAARKLTPGAKGDRGPLPARHVFASVWTAIHTSIETAFVQSFERHLAAKLKARGF